MNQSHLSVNKLLFLKAGYLEMEYCCFGESTNKFKATLGLHE